VDFAPIVHRGGENTPPATAAGSVASMRRLVTTDELTDEDLLGAYETHDRTPHPDRPWVLMNMVASLDGATAVEGTSGALGGAGDRRVFGVVRTVPDVIVVAAGTVRAEDYGPPRLGPAAMARRTARGQSPVPQLAVITRSAAIDPGSRLFGDGHRPIVITTEDAPTDAVSALATVADIERAGVGDVDLGAAMAMLARRGHLVALLEGGPSLNGQFVADGLVDELCLSVAPVLVAGASKRVAEGPAAAEGLGLALVHVLEHDDALFLRYARVTG